MQRRWGRYLISGMVCLLLLIAVTIANVRIGSVAISGAEIRQIFSGVHTDNYQILVNIRLTRIAFAIVSGATLAVSGLLLQIVLKNPMAESGFLGISSGASLATTLVLLVYPVAGHFVPLLSFAGGILTFVCIIFISWERSLSPTRLILTGAALSAVLRGLQSFLMTIYSDRLQGVITWQNGNLAGKTWGQFFTYLLYLAPAFILLVVFIPRINLLNLSDQTIYSLGVPVRQYRVIVSTIAVYLAAIAVSQVGMIGFVGLIVPHMAKTLVGGDVKVNLPFSALIGSLLLLTADLFARTVASPLEIPIGTVMSCLGGPFFLYLVAQKRRKEGEGHGF